MTDLLFVYGTLRSGNPNAMADFLSVNAAFVCQAWYQGKMYMIREYPGVIGSDQAGDRVLGEVYRLRDAQSVLAHLDAYEECSAHHASPTEYQRVETYVQTLDGEKLESVWIYLYQWSLQGKALIEGGDFMQLQQV